LAELFGVDRFPGATGSGQHRGQGGAGRGENIP